MKIALVKDGAAVPILIEEEAFEGVKRIGDTIASDIELVAGAKPERVTESILSGKKQEAVIFCATLGRSALLDRLVAEKKLETAGLEGKREVYRLALVEQPFEGVEKALVICGSDKRGTIYGMFALSEYLGVTPLVYWGDSAPAMRINPVVGEDICVISKEPSVRYRGFFINDEWPCFGSWVTSHFGDFNADAYKYIFEFLLRMKGNYLWPAMWSASFPLDGPGSANEELADIYGVVMGYSHHEPCLRASEEWDKVRGEDSVYGNEWNFYTNEQGLTRYWADALKRSGGYENVITIGMRGERDTSMLGDNATVSENVELLKRIITTQRQLIRNYVNEDLSSVPQMLALYKEVEAYFYGDDTVPGLKDWEELDDVICMLCEDNFGHMRTLPTEELRKHKGGFGMYYHFDYHGGPVSYEWVDSTPLTKTWEQMCMAYEYGIRELWIVNVGDVKLHEVPLTYFMALAYDYEKWGVSNPDSAAEFAAKWARENFSEAGGRLQEEIARVFTEYIDLLSLRRPEALNEFTYHPCHYLEADRMLKRAEAVERLSENILRELPEKEKKGYYSMVHFSAMAGMNLMKLHLYAGKNRHYALQGRAAANRFGTLAQECIQRDRVLAEEFGAFEGGKWNGMQLAPHIGFTKWNEDGCRYPVLCRVEPVQKPRLSVSRKDEEKIFLKNYGSPDVIEVHDFVSPGCDRVFLELSGDDGSSALFYEISPEQGELPEWLSVTPRSGTVTDLQEVELSLHRDRLPSGRAHTRLLVTDRDTVVAVEVEAEKTDLESLPPMTFVETDGVIVMDAAHYCEKKDTPTGAFRVLGGYGKYGSGVKVFPVTVSFEEAQEKPALTYRFLIREAGDYLVELLAAPTNSPEQGGSLSLSASADKGKPVSVTFLSGDFRAGDHRDERWCRGVLDQIRVAETKLHFDEGVRELTIGALEAGVVLERIRIRKADEKLPESYLGPSESAYSQNMISI